MASTWALTQREITSTRERWTTAPTYPSTRPRKNRHKRNARITAGNTVKRARLERSAPR